ncbi:MAG: sodium:solute symporter [Flavobacteriaceae bacterium]
MFETFEFTVIDLSILIGYLVLSKLIPLWLTRKKKSSSSGYFLGGKSFTWPMIGFSLFATNMSGSSFVGLAGAGYASGIAVYSYEWMAAIILVFFIFFLLPFYLRSGIFTMPEFLEKRYDHRVRRIFSVILIFFAVFLSSAGALYAGALVALILFPGTPLWVGVLVLALLAGVLSIFGGLKAVVISDTIQAVVLFIGGAIVFYYAMDAIPSWEALEAAAPEGALHIIQPADDPDLPWPGLFTGLLFIGIYFWATDQAMVQRVLGAKNINHGRFGAIFAGFLKLPILFIMVLPGVIAILLYPDLQTPDLVFPTLVADLIPVGLKGVILAALVAAITSSVDSVLNSTSTLVTMDFVKPFWPESSDKTLVNVGRITTLIVMIIAVLWAPQIQNFPSLWDYFQSTLAYTTPPIVALFIGGIFWKGANKQGAFASLILSLILGIMGFAAVEVMGLFYIHFLYSAAIMLAFSFMVLIIGSKLGKADAPEKTEGMIWTKQLWLEESKELKNVPIWNNYRYWSILLIATTAVIVGWFW